MGKNCPNYSHPDYKKLVTYFNGNEAEAKRVYIAQGYAIPEVQSVEQIREELQFRETNLSELSRAMLLKRVKNYNRKYGTSHRIKLERVSPTSYKAKLVLNFMPVYEPIAYNQNTVKTVNKISNEVEVETILSPSDIIVRDGNEFVANGEVYPSYEDAYNAIYNEKDSDIFFQISGDNTAPIQELNTFLEDFLKQYGIKIEYIDNFKERFNIDGIATADILNKTIYVAKGQEDSTTLPEEAAHFIIEMMDENHPLFKAMSGVISQTKEYQQVVDEYSEVYNNNKVKLKKEAMAKVLLTYFIKRNESKESLPVKSLSVFERVWNWFKGLFGKMNNIPLQQRINDIFGSIANKVFEGTIDLSTSNLTSEEMFFQLDTAKQSILTAIKRLEAHAKILERRALSPEYEKQAEIIKNNIEIIRSSIEKENIKLGITNLLRHAVTNELKLLRDTMDQIKTSPDEIKVTSALVNQLQDIISLYDQILQDIQEGINEDPDLTVWADEYEGLFADIRRDLSRGRAHVNVLMKSRVKDIIEEIKHPDSLYDINELLNSKAGDINGLVTYVAPLHSVNDEVLKMVYKLVQDIYMETHHLTLAEGKDLLAYQMELEKSGIKDLSIFHEKDSKGKKTGYLTSEFKWGEYNQAMEQTKADIVTELNKLGTTFEYYSDINRDNLTDKQLVKYKELWSKFGDKYLRNGKPNPPINTEFTKLMRNSATKNYYNQLLKMHVEAKDRLPKMYRSPSYFFLVPQIEKDTMQVITGSRDTLSKDLKEKAAEFWKFSSSDQEVGQNKDAIESISSKGSNRLVPVYFVRPLENKDLLSDDFTNMYAHFTEMSRNFRGLTNRLDDLFLIQQAIGKRTVRKGNKDVEGVLTNSYKILDDFLKQHIFKDYTKVEMKVGNKKYNITKIVKNVLGYVRGKNLFGAIFTIGSGYVKASIDSTIEDFIGTISTKESKIWAEGVFDSNIIHIMSSVGKRNKTNKIDMFFEHAGVYGEINKIFNRMDMQYRAGRITKDGIVYGAYEIAGVRVKGKLALSIYDNYRLVDGKYITRAQFKDNIIKKAKLALKSNNNLATPAELNKVGNRAWNERKKDWSKLRDKSLFNAFEQQGNKFVVKQDYKKYVTQDVINTVSGIIEQRSATIDGRLHNLEKAGIFNNLAGQAVMMHRGWLVSGAVERFKKGGINYITGQHEEGYYLTVTKFLWDVIAKNKMNLTQASALWHTLEPWQKRNMVRMSVDLAFTAMIWTLFMALQNLADDDDEDDWLVQAMAYQVTRIFLEQKAFQGLMEPIQMLNSPSAAVNLIDDVAAFGKAFTNNGIIEYGPYKGKRQAEKAAWRIFYLKNLYELQYPATKNKFIKSQIL